jgi:UDP-4-amino-4,6-dideoxy-N-acetyl-beta-L-altrosamine N-acetyltransferase
MEINKYGVKLVKLSKDKIELIREKRNSPEIQKYMQYREYITKEMQEQWFKRINRGNKNLYLVINYNGEDVGLINIKDINYRGKYAECGIFLWEPNCFHQGVSYRSYLCQLDYVFETLGLNHMIVHILEDNTRSIKFHEKFGFTLMEEEQQTNRKYILRKEVYFSLKNDIIKKYRI